MVVSDSKLVKAMIRNEGNQTKTAKELGIQPESVNGRLSRNPHLKEIVNNAKQKALIEAGLTRPDIYRVVKDGLSANTVVVSGKDAILTDTPDYKERRESAKIGLQLIGDLDKSSDSVDSITADDRVIIMERLRVMIAPR